MNLIKSISQKSFLTPDNVKVVRLDDVINCIRGFNDRASFSDVVRILDFQMKEGAYNVRQLVLDVYPGTPIGTLNAYLSKLEKAGYLKKMGYMKREKIKEFPEDLRHKDL